jgi:hypothetical protein
VIIMQFNWYQTKKQTPGTQFYQDAETFSLRDELHALLFGDMQNPGIGRPVLLRRVSDQRCVCFDGVTGSPHPGCRYCAGEGYLYTEVLHTVYLSKNQGSVLGATTGLSQQNAVAQWGMSDDTRALAYCEFNVFPDYERYLIPTTQTTDKLFELKVDDAGSLITRPWAAAGTWGALSDLTLGELEGRSWDSLSGQPGWTGGVIRTAKWKIKSVTPHHGDFGRVEILEVGLEHEVL